MLNRLFRNNATGDTIVEVMLALAILGLVLGGAYVVSNHNTLNERRAQERGVALQLAQGQIESMKQFASESSLATAYNSPFCMGLTSTSNGLTLNSTTSTYAPRANINPLTYTPSIKNPCYVDSSGNPSLTQPLYHLSEKLTGVTTLQTCSANFDCIYKVQVNWPDVDGSTLDVLTLYYKLYS